MDKICKAFGWWLGKWWHPLAVYLVTLALFAGFVLLDIGMNIKVVNPLVNVICSALFICLLLQVAVVFIAGIVLTFRKRAVTGMAFCLEMAGCLGISWFIFVVLLFAMMFNHKDTFADDLKLPENVELSEPLENGNRSFDAIPDEDPFFNALVKSLENGEDMADDGALRMPVLENLMSTEEGRAKLAAYFGASADWKFANNVFEGILAARSAYEGNGIYSMTENHFVWMEPPPGSRDGRHMQYSFRIYLDGYPDRFFAKKSIRDKEKERGVEVKNGVSTLNTWIEAGRARVYILAQGPGNVSAMTRKMVELVEAELASVDMADQGRPGRDTEVTLYNGMQGGMFVMDIWCNPGEPGELSITANEITTGKELSKSRLPEHSVLVYGSSEDKSYFSQIRFTIYEGDWEQYYGAHLQLWFTPENGAKRLLWEGDYRIQGWMR